MFTGIVEELGEIVSVERTPHYARVVVRGPVASSDAALGSSIAVNGCCLTVVELAGDTFAADVMRETLERTAEVKEGDRVNLERPVTLHSRLGGHLVQGHVDGTATITDRSPGERWETVLFTLPPSLARYVVPKGSIAVDGVSLTVVDAGEDTFSVGLIPATLEHTTLGRKQVGDRVNIETDIVAKYVERFTAPTGSPAATHEEQS
jgi:riboflavin synthase